MVENKINYAIGGSLSNNKTQAALLLESQRNILAMNANEKIAERDATTTLERDKIKAEQTTKIIIAIVLIVLFFIMIKFL
jgi:hypothetical protein